MCFKEPQYVILYPAKYPSKVKGKNKAFTKQIKLKEFVTSSLDLQEMLKEITQKERNW